MKKKIVSFLKNSHIQYFALGTVLAVVISFSLSAVFAQTNSTIYKFIQPDNGLVNRIGSLSVNRGSTASWINPKGWHSGNRDGKRETCLTTYGLSDKNEVESCLDVNGIGAFSKIITLDIPTFIYPTLFLNDSANFATTSGLPSGLIIEDDPNSTDDSILAAGLQYTDANGLLAPRDLTSKRNLCADKTTGELYPCGGTISYSCTGVTPDHAVMCQGDNTGLTANTPKTLVAACTTDTKCEFECMGGYHYDASTKTCELNTCIGTIPANATLCSGDDQGLDQDTNYTLVNSCTSDDKCETVCDTSNGYHYDASTKTCELNTCIGTIPANATLCSGDDQGLTQDTPYTLVGSCTAGTKCEYICDTNNSYHYDTNTQTCVADDTYHWETGNWGQCKDHYCETRFPGHFGWCSDIENQQACEDALGTPPNDQEQSVCVWESSPSPVSTRAVQCEDQNGNPVADSNCDASTKPDSTVECVNTCYEGEYGRNDTNYPDGGQVTYTKIDGNSYTKYHLYHGEKTHITYKRGTTPLAVIAHATRCDTGNGSSGNPVGCDQACGGSTGNYCSGTNGSWTLECQGPSSGEPVTGNEEGTCAWYKYNQGSNVHEWADC